MKGVPSAGVATALGAITALTQRTSLASMAFMSSLVWAADVPCGVEATVASATARMDRIPLTRDIVVVRHP